MGSMHRGQRFCLLSGAGDHLMICISGSINIIADVSICQVLFLADVTFDALDVNIPITELYKVFLPPKSRLPLFQDLIVQCPIIVERLDF